MSKRLQVLLSETEFEELKAMARERGTTVSELVRGAIKAIRDERSGGDPARKLEAIRRAARYEFPAGSIDEMLAEIERGYAET